MLLLIAGITTAIIIAIVVPLIIPSIISILISRVIAARSGRVANVLNTIAVVDTVLKAVIIAFLMPSVIRFAIILPVVRTWIVCERDIKGQK